jgi:integrase
MADYSIGKLKGQCVLVYYDSAGNRRRYRLGTADARQAAITAPAIFATLTRPKGKTVAEFWDVFTRDKAGRAIIGTMTYTWKALRERFGHLSGDAITDADCRAHADARRKAGIKDGTIHTELGHLRMVLNYAVKKKLLETASHIERPAAPPPSEKYLTRAQCKALIRAAEFPHVKLYLILALSTGARNGALLDLTWDRVDFARGKIDLRNPEIAVPHKGRAIVDMTDTVRKALQEAKAGAMSPYVIEWGGKKVASVKRGLHRAAMLAKVGHVSPHMLRHSVAVHLAESGTPMELIAQTLGHSNVDVTRRIYARFSPNYLSEALKVLEYGDLGSTNRRELSNSRLSA